MDIAKIIGIIVTAIVASLGFIFLMSLLFSLPVYWLWNWLMPIIFGLKEITWMQAWGLLLLSGFLLKSSASTKKE